MFLLQEPVFSGIVAALFFILLVIMWYKGKKRFVLQTIKYLVDYAEKKFGSGTGEIKYAYVVSRLYPELPLIIKLVVSPNMLDKWIEKAVDELQEKLEQEISEEN